MNRLAPPLACCAFATSASAQAVDAEVRRCLTVGSEGSPAAREVLDRWIPPRPIVSSLTAGFAVGPGGAPQATATLGVRLERLAPFHVEAQLRALVGDRIFFSAELLIGAEVWRRRSTYWRGVRASTTAPWSAAEPESPAALAAWLRASSSECGLSQGVWRLLGGARLFAPVDRAGAAPPLQFALMLGVARVASSYSASARTGLDLGLYGLVDPLGLRPGVMGRVGASWSKLVFGLEGAWVFGATGYAFAALDVGVRLSL